MITFNSISKSVAGLVGLVAVAMAGSPAMAQEVYAAPIELKRLVKGKTELDPEKGYIFVETRMRPSHFFIRKPLEEDIRAYEAAWEEAFAKAQKKYEGRFRAYEARRKAGSRKPKKPIKPTRESFAISDIETRLMVGIGPQYAFDKGKRADGTKYYQYLQEVDPGEYTYYGSIIFSDQGAFGACMCMGSLKFEVKAGEITSLGDFLTMGWADERALRQTTALLDQIEGRISEPTDWSVPESLNALPAVPADLQAAGKMNNFYRVMVSRMAPIEGVLRYDRDIVIDVKVEARQAAQAAADATAQAAQAAAPAVSMDVSSEVEAAVVEANLTAPPPAPALNEAQSSAQMSQDGIEEAAEEAAIETQDLASLK